MIKKSMVKKFVTADLKLEMEYTEEDYFVIVRLKDEIGVLFEAKEMVENKIGVFNSTQMFHRLIRKEIKELIS